MPVTSPSHSPSGSPYTSVSCLSLNDFIRVANFSIIMRTSNVLSGLFTLAGATASTLPPPGGQYGTGSAVAMLIDTSRHDPFANTTNSSQHRKLMVSAFYPVALREQCLEGQLRYMPAGTAAFYDAMYAAYGVANDTFGSLKLSSCNLSRHRAVLSKSFPVVLFSPGLGNSRLIYSAMAQSLASEGFIVVTIDHPYDTDFVEFTDGSTALAANITSDEQIAAAVDVRVKDIHFVMDQLPTKRTGDSLLGGHACAKNQKFTIFGHSLGGAAGAEATLQDSRLAAAINLDGTFFGPLLSRGAKSPLMIVAHDGKNLTTDPSWISVWQTTQKTTKVALAIGNTAHGSFTDLPLVVDTLGLPNAMREELDPLIGSLSGTHIRRVVTSLVKHFHDYVRCIEKTPLAKLNGTPHEILGEILGYKHCK